MIICYENSTKEIRKMVETKAKYQKVMILFDDSVSLVEIEEIHQGIKSLCVYNQSHIKDINMEEIFNGYRLIIYLCEIDSYLKCDFNKDEFINVFFPRDNIVLPYFLTNKNEIEKTNNVLILDSSKVDISAIASMYFNKFFNYFKGLMNGFYDLTWFNDAGEEITQFNVLNQINQLPNHLQFIDIEILRKCEICYADLILLDLLIIDAFLVLLTGVKSKSLMLVDVYKAAKADDKLIDKFYKLHNTEILTNAVILNYNCLYNYCLKSKEKILKLLRFCEVDKNKVNFLIDKIKKFAKEDSGLMGYLYLYNIFNV